MLVLLIDKVLLMLMFAAVLVTARHAYYLRAYVSSTEEDPVNYRLTERSLVYCVYLFHTYCP
jgi:phosphate starvation-inducible membrane PsiE